MIQLCLSVLWSVLLQTAHSILTSGCIESGTTRHSHIHLVLSTAFDLIMSHTHTIAHCAISITLSNSKHTHTPLPYHHPPSPLTRLCHSHSEWEVAECLHSLCYRSDTNSIRIIQIHHELLFQLHHNLYLIQ